MTSGTVNVDTLVETVKGARIEHTLAPLPPDWDYDTHGDYLLDENGDRKHADDCPGCASRAALSDLAARARAGETRVGSRGDATQDAIDHLARRVAELEAEKRDLHNEIDCRIEHGAESGGHLEFVRDRLAGDGGGA